MKTLTKKTARDIALKIAPSITPVSQSDFFLAHSEKVANIAVKLANKMNLDKDFFEIAGRVHDIGYINSIEKHAEHSLDILKNMGYEINNKLEDCILRHGNNHTPKTSEGRIFQIADKLSVFDTELIEIMLKYGDFPLSKEDMDFLRNMSEKALVLMYNFSNYTNNIH